MSSDQNVKATFTKTVAARPAQSNLRVSPAAFRATTKAKKHGPKHKHTGAIISYTDTEAAMATFTIDLVSKGVVSGQRCAAAPKHKGHGQHMKRCTASSRSATYCTPILPAETA